MACARPRVMGPLGWRVHGDVDGMLHIRFLAPNMVSEISTPEAGVEGGNEVDAPHVQQRVLDLGESLDVLLEHLAHVMDAKMKVPGVTWPVVGALKINEKEPCEVLPALLAIWEN